METINGEVVIDDISSDVIETFLIFLYQDKVDSDKINVDLLKVADRYNIQSLFDICITHLKNNVTVENAMEILVGAYLVNHHDLHLAAFTFAMEHKGQLIKSNKWDPDIAMKAMSKFMFKSWTWIFKSKSLCPF